jgi:DNA-binding transcriptional LysR family regulator
MVRALAAEGHGYALFNTRPRTNIALNGHRLVRIPLAGTHRPLRIGVATLKGLPISRLVAACIAHCRATISGTAIAGMQAPQEN